MWCWLRLKKQSKRCIGPWSLSYHTKTPRAQFSLLGACLMSSGFEMSRFPKWQLHHIVRARARTEKPDCHHSVYSFCLMVRDEKVISVILMHSLVTWKKKGGREQRPAHCTLSGSDRSQCSYASGKKKQRKRNERNKSELYDSVQLQYFSESCLQIRGIVGRPEKNRLES